MTLFIKLRDEQFKDIQETFKVNNLSTWDSWFDDMRKKGDKIMTTEELDELWRELHLRYTNG